MTPFGPEDLELALEDFSDPRLDEDLSCLELHHLLDKIITCHGLMSETAECLRRMNDQPELLGLCTAVELLTDHLAVRFHEVIPH